MESKKCLEDEMVSLPEMLAAREERVLRQRELQEKTGTTLVSFTLNIVGPRKRFPLAEKTFAEGEMLLLRQLERRKLPVLFTEKKSEKTGCEGLYCVDAPAKTVKECLAPLEDNTALGRFFDMDVLRPNGEKVARTEIGLPNRACMLCGEMAQLCARSRTHSVEELTRYTHFVMQNYFNQKYAQKIAQAAVKALLYEVLTTPKPGLVDRANCGAHHDMESSTFVDSAIALLPYFEAVTEKALVFEGTPQQLFSAIRLLGQEAEDAMFLATGGVNTHKGMVFSLGVLCAGLGFLHARALPENSDALLLLAAKMTAHGLDDFKNVTPQTAKTHGERLYAKYGITGIRGEAANGFPAVRTCALPVLQQLTKAGVPLNEAGVAALLHLMAAVQDTNLITRSNRETQQKIQQELAAFLKDKPSVAQIMQAAQKMDEVFIAKNLSPGGCADLLCLAFFLYFMF